MRNQPFVDSMCKNKKRFWPILLETLLVFDRLAAILRFHQRIGTVSYFQPAPNPVTPKQLVLGSFCSYPRVTCTNIEIFTVAGKKH
jgi:hypothetical protein